MPVFTLIFSWFKGILCRTVVCTYHINNKGHYQFDNGLRLQINGGGKLSFDSQFFDHPMIVGRSQAEFFCGISIRG
jgi:hypothetical protein